MENAGMVRSFALLCLLKESPGDISLHFTTTKCSRDLTNSKTNIYGLKDLILSV